MAVYAIARHLVPPATTNNYKLIDKLTITSNLSKDRVSAAAAVLPLWQSVQAYSNKILMHLEKVLKFENSVRNLDS